MIGRPLTRLSVNERGRDIVVSDIHGMVSLFFEELQRVGFDSESDRVICVGDLVNRGPESLRALSLLEEPWFYSVMGNHDLAAVIHLLGDHPDVRQDDALRFRLPTEGWLESLDAEKVSTVAARIAELPFLMEVDTPGGPVGVVHAEVPWNDATWEAVRDSVVRAFFEHAGMRELAPVVQGRRFMEAERAGRYLWKDDPTLTLPDILHVIHGHSIRHDNAFQPWRMGNRVHIDSGAFLTQPEWTEERALARAGEPGLTLVTIDAPMTPL